MLIRFIYSFIAAHGDFSEAAVTKVGTVVNGTNDIRVIWGQ